MKQYLFFIAIALGVASILPSCDTIENPYPQKVNLDLDTTFYPGIWSNYVANEWPDLASAPNENPNRNVLIEYFTGHQCGNCPPVANYIKGLYNNNPSRINIASIHSAPTGMSAFQELSTDYPVDFTNPQGLGFGSFFGTTLSSSSFDANPDASINRSGDPLFPSPGNYTTYIDDVLASSLKINIKAAVNYFPATKGFYLHTEIEKIDNSLSNDNLATIVYVIEDSLIAPQTNTAAGGLVTDYVHHDIMRGNLSGSQWGVDLIQGEEVSGKYYFNYSAPLMNQLASDGSVGAKNPENMHLLIYVYDKTTYEIYQVIKKKLV